MLNGKLSIERADNGWSLSWYDNLVPHWEVYLDGYDCLCKLAEVVGMVAGPAAARALLGAAEATQHVDPATDNEVAEYSAPGTPPTVAIGD